ncbi:UNVERIFIED_CONTAM: hypothetical protein Sradi_3956600 [Sesamum radiatum]|uniref:Reverse transcriptase domain-containing protein n=1 Tax=Sesamum radiatum TaxID=300843 RepID=A0AAW2PFS0_SESRA
MLQTLLLAARGRVGKSKENWKRWSANTTSDGVRVLHPLNASKGEILVVVEQQGLINQWPRKMKDISKKLKFDKYCRFYRDRSHTTEECHHLKNEVEKLIERGHLKEYINNYLTVGRVC